MATAVGARRTNAMNGFEATPVTTGTMGQEDL
jgi:hypothetical protein